MKLDERMSNLQEHSSKRDLDIEPVDSENEDYETGPAEYEISTYPADFTLEVLHSKWKRKEIDIPEFQRKFVWNQNQASKLIESFLAELPVPPVFLYAAKGSQILYVIDGQQRLRSIFYFFEGYFGEQKGGKRRLFSLTGLNDKSRWYDKSFENFDQPDQRKLMNSVLRAIIVRQIRPEDRTIMYHIFERLNTGGTPLSNQEVRNCVYRGELNNLLRELNKFAEHREILGKVDEDTRQKDVELILRFFCLRDNLPGYESPLKNFMSEYMQENRNPKEINQKRILFENTCKTVLETLGPKPFHIKRGINLSTYDSVMVAFSGHLDRIPSDINKRYRRLVKDAEFLECATSGTTAEDTIRKRFSIAERYLFNED